MRGHLPLVKENFPYSECRQKIVSLYISRVRTAKYSSSLLQCFQKVLLPHTWHVHSDHLTFPEKSHYSLNDLF